MNKPFFLISNLISILTGTKSFVASNDIHIRHAMNWLLRAQNMTSDNGVSKGFHMYHGWLPSYPETTGYIIEIFLDYYNQEKEMTYKDCALKMADWLIHIQGQDGAFTDSHFKNKMVFDTAQILFGLIRAYEETKEGKYKEAAIKTGEWILAQQEYNGSWINCAYHKIPHSYYTRAAWSLLALHEITPEKKYVAACRKNIEWALSNQCDNGWFNNASFTLQNHHKPFTHTIAYTIRGILEAGIYLKDEKYIYSVHRAMQNLLSKIPSTGFVSGTYDRNWNGNGTFSCLTGSAQLAIIFLKLSKILGSDEYFITGSKINQYLKSKQTIKTNNLNIKGALAGSYPIWGEYLHFAYPNWAAKFLIDSLVLETSLK
jgi:rhamnogalacturonyl hydrolase YesR